MDSLGHVTRHEDADPEHMEKIKEANGTKIKVSSTVPKDKYGSKKNINERRVILDLSWSKGKEVNEYSPKDYYIVFRLSFRLHYPSVDNLCDLVKQLRVASFLNGT